MKRIISLILAILLVAITTPLCLVSADDSKTLRFGADGKFRILVLADCQDDKNPDEDMIEAISQYLDMTNPDLVILTGDNVIEDTREDFKTGLEKLLAPIVSKNIPYAFTFGNHDDEFGVSKEEQYEIYKSIGNCLTTDSDPSLTGLGTCNIPVLNSNSDTMGFNIWIVDSNTYDKQNGGYDHVHEDQLSWLTERQNEITKNEGRIVNSLIFQHIIVPEITECLIGSTDGVWKYNGKKYLLKFNSKGSGTILESPCPPSQNSGEYDVVEKMEGVLGIVTGHDHINNFIAKPGTVDLIQVGGITYNSYGDSSVRGASLITIDENNTSEYSIIRLLNEKLFSGEYGYEETPPVYVQNVIGEKYISDLAIGAHATSGSEAKKQLTEQGYTVIDFDLNKGGGGDYIYLGYKTTNDVSDAVTSIKVTNVRESGYSETKQYRGIDYILASTTDLNKGISGSNFIYLYYSKQVNAGAPITSVIINQNEYTENYTPVSSFSGKSASDINKKAGGAYIYIHSQSSLPVIDATGFIKAYETAINTDTTGIEQEYVTELRNALASAEEIYTELKNTCRTNSSQSIINSKEYAINDALKNIYVGHTHTPATAVKENIIPSTCSTNGLYDNVVYCSVCKAELSRTKVETEKLQHEDKNNDGFCDSCNYQMNSECNHICHKNGFLGFIWKIINLFNRLFKTNPYCTCGEAHW